MNDNNLFESAFDAIDDKFLAEAKSPTIRIAAKRKKIIISAVAACVAAVLVAIPSVKVIGNLNDNKFTESEDTEIIYVTEVITSSEQSSTEQTLSGQQGISTPQSTSKPNDNSLGTMGSTGSDTIASSGGGYNNITIKVDDLYFVGMAYDSNGSTTTYEKVYTPDIKYLYINPIPSDKYITIYEGYYQKEIDQNEAQSLADKYFPKIINALHIPTPQYETEIDDDDIPNITISPKTGSYDFTEYYDIRFSITNMQNRNIIGVASGKNPLMINEKTFSINRQQNDTDIINSISGLKQELFNILDVSFDDAKVIRHFNGYDDFDVGYIWVLLYDSNAHTLNNRYGDFPYTDYILIEFDDYDDKSTDIYYANDIDYWSFRTENKSHSKPIAQKELLPLEKAEEYLHKGYVLAMDGCPLCQAAQTPIDFADYDYVSFEYKGGFNVGELAIPYYAFYKNIGTAENGNMIFAKTYVPAVEVEGYEEHFINQHNNHNTSTSNNDDYILDEIG